MSMIKTVKLKHIQKTIFFGAYSLMCKPYLLYAFVDDFICLFLCEIWFVISVEDTQREKRPVTMYSKG